MTALPVNLKHSQMWHIATMSTTPEEWRSLYTNQQVSAFQYDTHALTQLWVSDCDYKQVKLIILKYDHKNV
jgi:hypothetical protein